MNVGIVVLCYNEIALTRQCLDSLRGLDYRQAFVLIVDNASTDATADVVKATYPEFALISAGRNLGYAGGNNLGIETALRQGADAVYLLNNDTVVDPDCLTHLVRSLQAYPQTGIAGPLVYTWDPGRTISSAGGSIDWRRATATNVGAGDVDRGQFACRTVDFIAGCGLLITRTAIGRVGLIDERYFMYWEETDWCWRARKAGFDVRWVPAAQMRHKAPIHWQGLSATTLYYLTRNRIRFFALHTPAPQWPITIARAVKGAMTGSYKHRRSGRREHARATQYGVLHALQRQWGRTDPSLWQVMPTQAA